MEIGICCQGGSDPHRPQKVNQDAFFQASFVRIDDRDHDHDHDKIRSYDYTCIGVLDGHGLKGHIVSEYLSRHLPAFFQYYVEEFMGIELLPVANPSSSSSVDQQYQYQCLPEELKRRLVGGWPELDSFEDDLTTLGGLSVHELAKHNDCHETNKPTILHQAMIKAFHAAHYAAMQDPRVPAGRNGATCVMVVLEHHHDNSRCSDHPNVNTTPTTMIHVAHVGDSRVIQIDLLEKSANHSHTIDNDNNDNDNNNDKSPLDYYRVSQLSLETTIQMMEKEKERVVQRGAGPIRGNNNVFYGPVGIAMTRSLGNAVMLRAGVVPTPIVKSFSAAVVVPPPPPNGSMTTCRNDDNNKSYLVLGTDGIWDVLPNNVVAELLIEQQQQPQHGGGGGSDSHVVFVQAVCDRIVKEARRKWIGDDLPIVDDVGQVDDMTCMVISLA